MNQLTYILVVLPFMSKGGEKCNERKAIIMKNLDAYFVPRAQKIFGFIAESASTLCFLILYSLNQQMESAAVHK